MRFQCPRLNQSFGREGKTAPQQVRLEDGLYRQRGVPLDVFQQCLFRSGITRHHWLQLVRLRFSLRLDRQLKASQLDAYQKQKMNEVKCAHTQDEQLFIQRLPRSRPKAARGPMISLCHSRCVPTIL